MKSLNQNKYSLQTPTRAEYTAVNADYLLVKFLDRNKSFIAFPTWAADYIAMNSFDMIVMSPNSEEHFSIYSQVQKTYYAIVEQNPTNNRIHRDQLTTKNKVINIFKVFGF